MMCRICSSAKDARRCCLVVGVGARALASGSAALAGVSARLLSFAPIAKNYLWFPPCACVAFPRQTTGAATSILAIGGRPRSSGMLHLPLIVASLAALRLSPFNNFLARPPPAITTIVLDADVFRITPSHELTPNTIDAINQARPSRRSQTPWARRAAAPPRMCARGADANDEAAAAAGIAAADAADAGNYATAVGAGGRRWSATRRAALTQSAAVAVAAVTPGGAAFADAGMAAGPTAAPTSGPAVRLSRPQINSKLGKVPIVAIVNEEDAPFLTGGNGRIGYFFLDAIEALRELKLLQKNSPEARLKVVTLPEVYFPLVRGEQANLGGTLRVRPARKQVVLANRALNFQMKEGQILPTTLDEGKGQVPVFYSERVAYEDNAGGQLFPFFLSKDDLDAAYVELQKTTGAAAAGGSGGGEGGIPIGLVRIATLDGLVDQMLSGEVDLSKAVLVPSKASLNAVRALVAEQQQQGAPPAAGPPPAPTG